MRKIIFSLSMLVSNPVGLVYIVLTGVAGFALLNELLPRDYFAAVAIIGGLVLGLTFLFVISEKNHTVKPTYSQANLFNDDNDEDTLILSADVASTWISSETGISL